MSRHQHNDEKRLIAAALQDVVRHGQFVLGPEVDALERKLASWLGRRFAVGCNSGFGAHLLALLTLHVGHGSTAAIPAYSPPAFAGGE
jgi:dTDP-4-amino-4,6-dideoxygalactose transaminase